VWRDIWPPPPLTEPADAPVRIAYSPEHALCLRLFAAVSARGEASGRAAALAAALIGHCPAFYSAWALRRACAVAAAVGSGGGGPGSQSVPWPAQQPA
jgi:hypothetical protein